MYHGLLRYQTIIPECKIIYNKVFNVVQNMLNIVRFVFDIGQRSSVFCRVINY